MGKSFTLTSGGVVSSDYLQHARETFLKNDEVESFLAACGRPLRKSIRVNTLKISVEDFLKIAEGYQWQLTPIPWCPQGFWITDESLGDIALGNLPEHILGLFYIQEASSMLPPFALLNGEVLNDPYIVDMAAAPGSKTTQLAAMVNNQGLVLANELSASRLKGLHANLVRCGIINTCMSHLDARKIGEFVPEYFDYVLLDAPCGGEGTIRKDNHALENWNLKKVSELAELQKQLILSAYNALRPGGKLVYSTCTMSPEENHQVAAFLLQETDAKTNSLQQLFPGAERAITAEGYLHILPHTYDSEGFFVASFSKPSSSHEAPTRKVIYQSPFKKIDKKIRKSLSNYYLSHFGIDIEIEGFELKQRDKEVWLFPDTVEDINQYLKINRGGMKIAEVYPNKTRTTHEFVMAFGLQAKRQIGELNLSEMEAFLSGNNLNLKNNDFSDGEVILKYQGQIVGLVQNQKGKQKNGLPRDLVKHGIKLS